MTERYKATAVKYGMVAACILLAVVVFYEDIGNDVNQLMAGIAVRIEQHIECSERRDTRISRYDPTVGSCADRKP